MIIIFITKLFKIKIKKKNCKKKIMLKLFLKKVKLKILIKKFFKNCFSHCLFYLITDVKVLNCRFKKIIKFFKH